MTEEQVHEAIGKLIDRCAAKMDGYQPAAARPMLEELDYRGEDVEQVLQHIYDGGFTYCLDPKFEATHFDPNNARAVNGMVTDRAPMRACYWGPDQLSSRLACLSNVPYTVRNRSRV